MNTRSILNPRFLLPALLMGFAVGVTAQDDFFLDDDELDDVVEVVYHDAEIEIGIGYQDKDSRHFGRNSGLKREGFSPVIDLRARGLPDWDSESAYYWRAEVRRLGLDSRRVAIEAGEQGRQTFHFSWREMPNYRIEGGLTPFQGQGSGFFSLSPGWVATGNNTAGMAALRNDLNPVQVGTDRRRLDLGYWRSLRDRWTFNVDLRNETREGSRLVGSVFGFTGGNPRSTHLPAPVDQTTRIVDSSLEFAGDRHVLGVAYHGSFFENSHSSFAWQNPYGQHPQWAPGTRFPDGTGRMSQAPDNQFHQVRTYGAWQLGERSRFNADVAFGRMRQDEDFLAYTINPFIELEALLPRHSLDGEIKTTLVNFSLTSRSADSLNLSLNYRYDDRDNDTPMDAYRLVGADSEQQKTFNNARINLPYSYRKQELNGDANWRWTRQARLVGGLRFIREDRDNFSEVAKLDEWAASVGVRGSLSPRASYRLDYEYADREFDEYDGRAPYVAGHVPGSVGPDSFENHPNLRKYNMADRERDQLRARVDLQPLDVFSVGFNFQYSKDDFDDGRFGLQHARVQSLSTDFGFYPNDHVGYSGFYSHDRYQAAQSGRDWPGFAPQLAFDPNRNWFVDHDDEIDTISLTLELIDISRRFESLSRAGLNRKLDMGFNFLFMRTRGEIDVNTAPGLNAEPLPDTVDRLNGYKVWAKYQFATQWYTRIGVEHERFDSQNFALDNVEIDTLANVLLLGQQSPSYNITWLTLSVGYQF